MHQSTPTIIITLPLLLQHGHEGRCIKWYAHFVTASSVFSFVCHMKLNAQAHEACIGLSVQSQRLNALASPLKCVSIKTTRDDSGSFVAGQLQVWSQAIGLAVVQMCAQARNSAALRQEWNTETRWLHPPTPKRPQACVCPCLLFMLLLLLLLPIFMCSRRCVTCQA
jgi:hypothetical protein